MAGYGRKRTLLLWHAMEQARAAAAEKGELLRLALRALEPPEDPLVQVRVLPVRGGGGVH